mgnify:FL=1
MATLGICLDADWLAHMYNFSIIITEPQTTSTRLNAVMMCLRILLLASFTACGKSQFLSDCSNILFLDNFSLLSTFPHSLSLSTPSGSALSLSLCLSLSLSLFLSLIGSLPLFTLCHYFLMAVTEATHLVSIPQPQSVERCM